MRSKWIEVFGPIKAERHRKAPCSRDTNQCDKSVLSRTLEFDRTWFGRIRTVYDTVRTALGCPIRCGFFRETRNSFGSALCQWWAEITQTVKLCRFGRSGQKMCGPRPLCRMNLSLILRSTQCLIFLAAHTMSFCIISSRLFDHARSGCPHAHTRLNEMRSKIDNVKRSHASTVGLEWIASAERLRDAIGFCVHCSPSKRENHRDRPQLTSMCVQVLAWPAFATSNSTMVECADSKCAAKAMKRHRIRLHF